MKQSAASLQRVILEAFVIAALGAVIGLSLHQRLIFDAFTGPAAAEPPGGSAEMTDYPSPVTLDETRRLLAAGALAVDARTPEAHREGRLPGAVSLPLETAANELPAFRAAVPAGRTLVTYCSGYGCTDSFDLAVLLKKGGYQDVRVFEGGFPQWRDAGLPMEAGDAD